MAFHGKHRGPGGAVGGPEPCPRPARALRLLGPGSQRSGRDGGSTPDRRRTRADARRNAWIATDTMSEADDTVRKGYLVRGRVQGVGFRWSTTRTAEQLDVRGTVRNRADGAVEVHAEGTEEAIRDLEAWLREGPRAARVDDLEEIDPEDDLPHGFEIIR